MTITTVNQPKGLVVGGRKLIIGDGAMSTYLHQCGVPIRVCVEELNLSAPKLIEDVHRAYVEAGASVIQTNTFAANRPSLHRYRLGEETASLNTTAVEVARRAAADQADVYGTIGPVQGGTRYGGALLEEERTTLQSLYREQAQALLAGGVQGWVLETFPDLEELLMAVQVVRSLSDLPLVANISPQEIGVSRDGVPIDEAFRQLREEGADVTGLNCRLGPYGILRSYERLPYAEGTYAAVPNSGVLHRNENDALSFTGDEQNFVDVMLQISRLGVTWLGGCCGTTPAHIHALVNRLAELDAKLLPEPKVRVVTESVLTSEQTQGRESTDSRRPLSGPSIVEHWKARTTVIVELDPPKVLDCDRFIEGAEALQRAGADMVTMADNSLGTVRVSNLALASLLKQHGIEPLVHVTCRDRNLIGQQSHLMGLHVLGIRNILLITGDPSRYGDLPGATSVYDVSSMDLTKMVRRLNEGIGFSGKPLQRPAQFVIGTAFNPNVRNFSKAVERLQRKVAAGADYVMTQPVYDEEMMEKIAIATRDLGVPILLGIMPLTSLRNAQFLHHQVPGISIPEDVLLKMQECTTEEAAEVGYAVAKQLCDRALQYFRGLYLVTPFLKYETTVRLTQYIRSVTGSATISNEAEFSVSKV